MLFRSPARFPLVLTFLLLACAPASDADGRIRTGRLANGLEIVVITDKRAPVVTHMVWYRAGAAEDPDGKSGIAHFLEHLMFKGTEKIPLGGFSEKIASMGGSDNAFTSHDYTAYFQRIASDRLEDVMVLEADRMKGLIFSEAPALAERGVVLEERASRTDSSPPALLGEKMRRALHAPHPYARPIIGWREEIGKLTVRDAEAFYRRHYAPDNAVLVVVGDAEMPEVRKLAERIYGPIPAGLNPGVPRRPAAPRSGPETIHMQDVRTRQPLLQRLYRLPEWERPDAKSFAALDMLMQILSSGTTGRLYQKLVVEQKIAVGTGGWADTMRLDQGEAALYVSPRRSGDIDAVLAMLDAEIERLKTETVSDEELARAKTGILAETLYARDSQFAQARIYGTALAVGLTVEDVDGWTQDIEAVSPGDIRRAANAYLDINRSVTGVLTPADGAAGAGEAK